MPVPTKEISFLEVEELSLHENGRMAYHQLFQEIDPNLQRILYAIDFLLILSIWWDGLPLETW